jgi:hypothetical protein
MKKNIIRRSKRALRKLKSQTPGTKFQTSSKRTKSKTETYEFGHLILGFENYLEFGIWNLEIGLRSFPLPALYYSFAKSLNFVRHILVEHASLKSPPTALKL